MCTHNSLGHPMCVSTPLAMSIYSRAISEFVLPKNSRPPLFKKWSTSHCSLIWWLEPWAPDPLPIVNCLNWMVSTYSELVGLENGTLASTPSGDMSYNPTTDGVIGTSKNSTLGGGSGGTLLGWEVLTWACTSNYYHIEEYIQQSAQILPWLVPDQTCSQVLLLKSLLPLVQNPENHCTRVCHCVRHERKGLPKACRCRWYTTSELWPTSTLSISHLNWH